MKSPFRDLPIAWLQLKHTPTTLMAAVLGVTFADVLLWMQFGFLAALFDSATYVHGLSAGDLVALHPQSRRFATTLPFPRRLLTRALGHADVDVISSLYTGVVYWKNPWNGDKRRLFLYGVTPHSPAINAPGISESRERLNETNTCLFDVASRPEYRAFAKSLYNGRTVEAEIEGHRFTIVGTTRIGVGFDVDGNLVTSDANFARIFRGRTLNSINMGVIRLRPNANVERVKHELRRFLGDDLKILSIAEFIAAEKSHLRKATPITFIFMLSAGVGLLVGFAIVYQVLFADISKHLPQYATLKAIGYSDDYLNQIVLQESFILSILGFVPATVLSAALYQFTVDATNLPMHMTLARGATIFGLTVAMCGFSGLMATQKLRQADPADVF